MASQEVPPPSDSPEKSQVEAAEQEMVKESAAAGVPAFQFDPNESSTQKREQVEQALDQVLPPEAQRQKHVAEPVAIDLDTDKKTDPKIAGKEDQKSVRTASLTKTTTEQSDAKSVASVQRVGTPVDPFTPERTGWAPRFLDEDKDDGMNNDETLLDHQTWLEQRVDDRFFGGTFALL
ncbi:hypothetical protein KEM55_002739 [Ascosphaera atra]|nr:hypothetical protein KEM55_002739 [Ascosphaera atra]